MPDATARETSTDILVSGEHEIGDVLAGRWAVSESDKRLAAARVKRDRVNELSQANPNNLKEELTQTASLPEYSTTELDETREGLKTTETDYRLEQIATDLESLAQYLTASAESQMKGIPLDRALGRSAIDIKSAVGALLVDRGRLLEKFPDLKESYEGGGPELNVLIEALIARDPRFQLEIARVLSGIHAEATKLKSGEGSEEKSKLDTQKGSLEKLQDSLVAQIKSSFGTRLTTEQQDQIAKLIEAGNDMPTIIESLRVELKIENFFDDYKKFESSNRQHIAEEEEFQKQLDVENANIDPKTGSTRRPHEITRLAGLVAQARARSNMAKASMNSHKDAYKASHPGITDEQFLGKYQEHISTTSLIEDGGPIAKTVDTAVRNQAKLAGLESQIKALENTPGNEDVKKKRADLLKRLETSVDTAMSSFLEQKYNDYVSGQNILTEAAVKEAEKQNKDWKAGALKSLKASMDAWSHFNPTTRKFERNKDKISASVRTLIENSASGEDGSRQMIAEAAGFNLDEKALKKNIANELYAAIGGVPIPYESLSVEEKTKVDEIARQRTKEFEEIFAEHGENYKKRLFTELNSARGFADKIGAGKLFLTNDETALLNKQFGPMMEKALENSGAMQTLREKGINPSAKMKWAMFLMIMLGVGIAGVVVAPTVVATGAAIKTLG